MSETVTLRKWDAVEVGVEISGLPETISLEIMQEFKPGYTFEADPVFLHIKRQKPNITPRDVLDTSTIVMDGSASYWRGRLKKLGYNVQVSEST
jgi:hypothetical protein